MSDAAVSASAKGATFLILLQIGSRAVTFALNQILLRFLSPELLGVSVQLELYIISTLYFARESLRIAAQRRLDGGVQAAINLSYLAIAAGLPIGLLLAFLYLQTNLPNVAYLHTALIVNLGAAMVELCSEPAFVAVQQEMLYRVRASAEATAVVLKTFATAGMVFYARYLDEDFGVLPFAVGELAWSLSLAAVYILRTIPVGQQQGFRLLPQTVGSSVKDNYLLSLFSKPLLSLSLSLYLQNGIKYVLTQGDSILIATLASLEDQGMYALSANYGGLIARMLFRPIEDSSRNLFANLCAPAKPSTNSNSTEKDKPKQPDASVQQAATILRDILRIYTLISLLAFAIGPSAAPLLLRLVAGQKWSDTGAGEVLGTYCYYIPLLAINGVSEAFVAATADEKELRYQSIWMGGFSAGFAASAYLFLRVLEMGAKGLVWANCVNMALRIVFNLSFVRRYFGSKTVAFNVTDLLPNAYAVAATAVCSGILSQTAGMLQQYGLFGELVRVGGIGGALAVTLAVTEHRFLLECYSRFRT